eukprot:CAMPEP_0170330902 /NCGR_PEP_ID=MMETSP0116_2-20130129/66405_1 /TAXON_ID=400756 /ORGANISM="Durinskia baltica, Strain CSIRO CS-38" /LENGTH=292 /DNA_ID=CAMNT_0010584113 /DNA_START=27 /DNA_END=906 /DNA_ORIENTATION=-
MARACQGSHVRRVAGGRRGHRRHRVCPRLTTPSAAAQPDVLLTGHAAQHASKAWRKRDARTHGGVWKTHNVHIGHAHHDLRVVPVPEPPDLLLMEGFDGNFSATASAGFSTNMLASRSLRPTGGAMPEKRVVHPLAAQWRDSAPPRDAAMGAWVAGGMRVAAGGGGLRDRVVANQDLLVAALLLAPLRDLVCGGLGCAHFHGALLLGGGRTELLSTAQAAAIERVLLLAEPDKGVPQVRAAACLARDGDVGERALEAIAIQDVLDVLLLVLARDVPQQYGHLFVVLHPLRRG